MWCIRMLCHAVAAISFSYAGLSVAPCAIPITPIGVGIFPAGINIEPIGAYIVPEGVNVQPQVGCSPSVGLLAPSPAYHSVCEGHWDVWHGKESCPVPCQSEVAPCSSHTCRYAPFFMTLLPMRIYASRLHSIMDIIM